MIFLILVFSMHIIFLIPESLRTKKNELMWRILTKIPLAFVLVAAFIANRYFVLFDILINAAHFCKACSAIMLKA